MKTFVLAALATVSMIGMATAADLPSRKSAPVAPVMTAAPKFYVGVNGGMLGAENTTGTAGAVAGYNFNQNISGEVTYDYRFRSSNIPDGHLVMGNIVVGQSFGSVRPYALAGVGYEWNSRNGFKDFAFLRDRYDDRFVYNVGAGVKFAVSNNFDVDARYRYINGFSNQDQYKPEHRLTVGVNYNF